VYVVARRQQKITAQKVVAVAVAMAGIALTIGIVGSHSGFRLDTYGLVAAMLASFSFAFYNVGGHRILARHDRWRVLTWTLASASAFWLLVNPPWKVIATHYTAAQWAFLFVFSVISVLGSFSLYFLGLQHLEPTRAIIASCLEPVFSILLAAAFLGEGVRAIQTLGIILVLSAIVIVQMPGRDRMQKPILVDPIE
jgi:DME family drug/metabolite transporter